MLATKLYRARLSYRTVGVMAFDLEDARLCLQELYPNDSIQSLLLAPEWFDDDSDD